MGRALYHERKRRAIVNFLRLSDPPANLCHAGDVPRLEEVEAARRARPGQEKRHETQVDRPHRGLGATGAGLGWDRVAVQSPVRG